MAAIALPASRVVTCRSSFLSQGTIFQTARICSSPFPSKKDGSILELKASFTSGCGKVVLKPRGAPFSGRAAFTTRAQDAAAFIRQSIAADPVVVFGTSWCPYCTAVKGLFDKMGVKYKDIDVEAVGGIDVRGGLLQLTGQRTVPNVFIDTMALRAAGKLVPLLQAAGVSYKQA